MVKLACDQCASKGLPIMPVRYTVVPKDVKPGLPGWASGQRVKEVALGSEFQYALRTMRTGFLYIFYETNKEGSNKWECYAVGEDGCFTIQPSPAAAWPQSTPALACSRHALNTQVHYIVISEPEKCGPTWIAYSEHKWSKETVQGYERNSKLRNKRMQTIHPAQMAAGVKHSHGAIATQATLEDILEYASVAPTGSLPFDRKVSDLSEENGSYSTMDLHRMSTRYPWHLRTGMAEGTIVHMVCRNKGAGKPSEPHVLAMWDAIGIAHELNGYRNDAAGWIKKYGDERELQIAALNNYKGLRNALENQAFSRGEEHVLRGAQDGPLQSAQRELEEKSRTSPDDEYLRKQLDQVRILNSKISAGAPRLSEEFGKSLAGKAWPPYRERIDTDESERVEKKLAEFHAAAAFIVDQRTIPLIRWLEAQLLLDTFNDFDGHNLLDGMVFGEQVAEAIWGIGSCRSGAQKIETWVKECKATVESNLLWRVVALNQMHAREELDEKLNEAVHHKSEQTLASTLTWIGYSAKFMKSIADTYKKAQSVFDANVKAATGTSSAFGASINKVNVHGADKFAITVGDFIFKHFRVDKLGDYASEKIIQHIFSVRAFVNPMESEDLIAKQVAAEKIGRAQTLRRLQATKTFMKLDTREIHTQQTEGLRTAWAKFKVSDDVKAPQAIKDARLAMVVMLIEGVNFSKLLIESKTKNDMKSWLSLLASGMSIGSALMDIATVPIKNMPGMGAETWGYQVVKGWGGVLSGGAAWVGVYLDFEDSKQADAKGYGNLYWLYALKGGLGVANGALTFAVTFTYAAPLVARLTGRAAAGAAIEAVGARAAAIIGLRILGMAAGGWITVGMLGVQVVIWWISPNAIEDWIDHSAFGKKRSTGGYKTAKEQDEKMKKALIEMGLQ
ncbi:T6SS effector BTH_I2691 family protein [Variovorax sp. dw_308]|uniref:T6SS effector BTH_I2691 family protein n=1 Tax=Variovorax sp. dw_308 TaxID=2721546 RepID=UPI001C43B574|nr:T6SS effector BTH_I2691 family protein [Variovorax sp. dw_308]